ncbi:hypothetical protein FYJ38_09425 [Clostridium sp. WB02_MRS01]|uniref:hypothetical protein n=1 Tax=Clostridium sp. WB02_MRS01 TaxID=2605777 RepID=UPI0012B28E0E|nr:hypothetical protein [Clostridium sp. WB02_MRS01]MSS08866.1 hypothetical protein [Clostridium sp. WB02_MRS01]
MDNNMDVTNAEIIEFLNFTHEILKLTKSSLDLDRLNTIINILKKDEKKQYSVKDKKAIVKYEVIINILEKKDNSSEMSEVENNIYKDFESHTPYYKIILDKDYEQLYKYLHNENKKLTVGDLSVLYFCLYKQRTRQKKKADILSGIYSYIEQNLYFNNMDLKFNNHYNNFKH